VFGRWASARALQPLDGVARAASEISAGRLDARLDDGGDADLAVIAGSFNRMAGALQRRIERDARFASDISHELRSPLTTLVGAVEVIQAHRQALPAQGRQALDLLGAEVARFERMVQDLLEISRFDAGTDSPVLDDVRAGELVCQALAATGRRGVPVEVAPDARDVGIRVDKRRLERVLANLADNADLHGGGLVRVGVERVGDAVQLLVEDQGPGVPVAHRERIFERFSRGPGTDGRAKGQGVGLGLALAAGHVELLGGRVWVQGRPGGGASFVVELPMAPP
jgi:two-component system sensor histidine kinase MtrB